MTDRTISAKDLHRLRRERDAADRQYNDALTALNRSLRSRPEIPPPPPAFDGTELDAAQRLAAETVAPPLRPGGGWRGWVQRCVWSVVGPSLARQEQINQALIGHLTRNLTGQRETQKVIATGLTLLRDELHARHTFEFWVAAWAQRVTPYVDTKDRESTGLIRRINENPVRVLERTIGLLQQRQLAMKRRLEELLAQTPSPPIETNAPGTPRQRRPRHSRRQPARRL